MLAGVRVNCSPFFFRFFFSLCVRLMRHSRDDVERVGTRDFMSFFERDGQYFLFDNALSSTYRVQRSYATKRVQTCTRKTQGAVRTCRDSSNTLRADGGRGKTPEPPRSEFVVTIKPWPCASCIYRVGLSTPTSAVRDLLRCTVNGV